MYVVGADGDNVNEYSLSSAWDISTASYVQNFSVASQETGPGGVFFKPDGTKMYICGAIGDEVNEFGLSSAWDISTASYVQNFSIAAQESNARVVFFHPDGSGFYVVGTTNDTVYQYTIGGFSVAAQTQDLESLFFKPDGTKMYILDTNGDEVNEYDLSTAWDILTASYLQNFSVATQDTSPTGLFFKPDGTKMYILGNNGDDVNEYNLSSAWNISTASYVQNFSVSTQDTSPTGLFFKPDGTKMYILGNTGDDVNEYDLSSAWNISTASYVQNFSVASQNTVPQELFFKPDGTKMYFTSNNGNLYQYNLSSAWDISTANYIQNLTTQAGSARGIFWKDDGTQFFIGNPVSDRVFSYLISEE